MYKNFQFLRFTYIYYQLSAKAIQKINNRPLCIYYCISRITM